MFRAAPGHGESLDVADATRMAIRRCRAALGDAAPQAGIVFAGALFDHTAMLSDIQTAFPEIPIVGCTSAGQIASGYGLSDDAVDLLVFSGDGIRTGTGAGTGLSRDPVAAVDEAVETARTALAEKPVLCLAFSDGVHADTDAMMRHLTRRLGPDCPVFGGAAGSESLQIAKTRQFLHDRVLSDSLVLMLLGGNIRYSVSISNSWMPIGPAAVVEETQGRDVIRIDGRRALDFYRYYLGPHSEPAIELPLAVFESADDDSFYIRGPVAFYESTGAVSLTGAIPCGARIRLTEATRERILLDTRKAGTDAVTAFPGKAAPAAALLFSCTNRRRILGTRTVEELEILNSILPPALPAMGFYTFGEFAPLGTDRASRVHNCTLVTLVIGSPPAQGRQLPPLSPPPAVTEDPPSNLLGHLEQQYRFLKIQLNRSEAERRRLESVKEANTALLRRVNDEVNAARIEIERKNRVLRQALSLAEEVQQSLLPQHPPRLPGFDIAGRIRYHSETGGDYYDFLQPADAPGPLSIVVGDVSGHGVAAALLMTAARALLRSRADRSGPIAEMVTDINRLLTRDISDSGRFMTLFFLQMDAAGQWLRWVRAGHDPALLYDPATDQVSSLSGHGMALGVDRDSVYEENTHPGLLPGQLLVMGTDGLWEARNSAGDMFGKKRVITGIRQAADLEAEAVIETIFRQIDTFLDDCEAEDDMTLVVVRRKEIADTLFLSAGEGI